MKNADVRITLNGGDPAEYAWAQCAYCRNTVKFEQYFGVCPACGTEYEAVTEQYAIVTGLPSNLFDED